MDFASGATDPVKAELRLHENFAAALNIGLGIGFLQTHALRDLLGIPVHGAFGYSLGEITMLYALGSRQRVDPDLSRDEDLFRERLGGPKTAIRELWGIANEVPDEEVWTTMVLFAEAEVVRAEVECRDHVFLTHINTPGETVIAGNPGACRAVMRALGCPGLPTAVSYVLHCPAVDLQKMNDYIDYRLGPIRRPTDHVELFSGHRAEPLTDFADAAGTAAATLRRAVDFPRLVQSLYRSGYRYFIEVGPGATATRWIGDTLAGRQHLAISADRRGAGTAAGAARMLARLASHGVHIDLSRLVTPTTNKEMSCPTQ
jgi:acyl transferase domain-containing protein